MTPTPSPQAAAPRRAEDRPEDQALLGELTGSVAHEFNNILNNIMLHLAVLEQKGLPPELKAETAQLKQSGRQAAALVRQLQQYNQERQPPLEPVDQNQLVRDTVDATVPTDLAADLPPVLGNPTDLKRLVRLLVNHCQAAAPGSVRVRSERSSFGVALHVADDGPTVEPELLAKQFHPFVVSRPGSDGVRLTVCKNLVRRLQGIIRGENGPSGGMVYVVELRAAG